MKRQFYFGLALGALMAGAALATSLNTAPTRLVDVAALDSGVLHDVGAIRPLARNSEGQVLLAIAELPDGAVTPPHAGADGRVRFATVLSGTLYYADGDTVNPEAEVAYEPGSILRIAPDTMHWAAARAGDVRFLVSIVPADAPVAALAE